MLRLSHDQLVAWGESFGRGLRAPRVVTLRGDLGTGKTTLAQAICRGYGVHEPVTSPTFALVHEYRAGARPVYHLDLYRLRDARELLQLGWEEIIDADALILVEWPERAGDALPPGALHLVLAHVAGANDVRELHVDG